MIFHMIECIIMEWTIPNESRICRMQQGAYPENKTECCRPICRSQVQVRNVLLDLKIKQGRLRGRQVQGIFCQPAEI